MSHEHNFTVGEWANPGGDVCADCGKTRADVMSAPEWIAVHEDGTTVPLGADGSFTATRRGRWRIARTYSLERP